MFGFRMLLAVATILVATPTIHAMAGEKSAITGVWTTGNNSEVTIKTCAQGHCGFLSKVVIPPAIYNQNKAAIDKIGIDKVYDYFNKDPKLRSRPLKGLRVLTLTEKESDTRFRGEIYNAEDGNTYSGILDVVNSRTLTLSGCGFFDLLCKSETWVRVAGTH